MYQEVQWGRFRMTAYIHVYVKARFVTSGQFQNRPARFQAVQPFRSPLLVLYDEYMLQNFTKAVRRKELGNNSTHDILCN